MFEGLVRQLLLGYLGQYVKDIQKEQLKITLWHEEILLENVELILEAFDYLRLPFALKQGRIGRLSIKIPWKKLGWDPIIIVVDNVFICACQRDDEEWSSDSVERREFAGKKAKLAAAELAKLSRRVCDNQAGQSFISYITEKIIDGIQVSIKNVDVLYVDQKSDMGQFVLGLRFSSLMIINRNPIGSSALKPRSSQVNKIIEISNLGIYCSTFQGNIDLVAISNVGGSQLGTNVGSECYKYDYILAPFDMAVSLVVNRPGRPETGGPQYYISAELTSLVMLLDEIQLQQIYKLWDYLCTCHLREKYGRFRPWYYPLSGKPMGWQRMWWHFAQESVLSDVRKKLKKNAWKYLAHRISYRRKYVSLYKIKLKLLLKDQPLDEDILRELEQMEKESDLDDILSYRSIAEDQLQLQESPPNSKTSVGISGMNIAVEKQQNDESLSSRSRGWLNWLSRGMLGAGGTDDSGQFSGIISDEIIKDIYEATMFHPMPSLDEDSTTIPRVHLSLIKFNIHKITSALGSKRHKCKIVELNFDGVVIECKLWEESVSISALVNSAEIICPRSKKVVLLQKKRFFKKDLLRKGRPFITVQVDRSLVNREIELLVKIMLEPFEVSYHSEVLLSLLDFYYLLDSFESQQERVISSLNGFENTKARVLSKAEYVFLNRNKVIWDVCLSNVIINIPWRNEVSESFNMVLESSDIVIKSSGGSGNQDQHDYLLRSSSSASTNDIPLGIELQNFYDLFEISVSGFEVNIIIPDCPQAVPVFERFTAHITLASCIIPDESMLKQLEVNFVVTSLNVHLSPSLYGAVVGVISYLHVQQKNSEKLFQGSPDLYDIKSSDLKMSNLFQFSLSASLKLVNVHFNLADDSEDSMALIFGLGGLDIQYDLKEDIEEYWVCVKTLKIDTCAHRHESESHLLCLSMNMSSGNFAYQNEEGSQASSPVDDCGDTSSPDDACFLLHYQAQQTVVVNCHKYTIFLNDVDLHCYPHVVRSLHGFCDKISAYGSSSPPENHGSIVRDVNPVWFPDFGFQKFGFTNFFETGSSSEAGISLDHFPFVTIFNSEPLGNLGSSLIYGIPDWRKLFHVIGRKTARSPKLSTRMGSRIFDVPELKLPYNLNSFPLSGSSVNTDLFAFNFIFNGIRVHFHDSSCILGTVTVPTSRSLLYICENYWDIFCSAEGLIFSSSWFSQNFHEYLWGPLLPNLSPILNVRVKNAGESFSQIEISIGIQHTCCVLPFEFLSMLIGYFSLSDWSSSSNDLQILENSENKIDIRYKFEILDSMLIFPLEGNEHHSLLFGLQQLYCNFIPMSNSEDAVKDIPTDCLVPSHKVAATIHLLNVFMRDLSLSLRLLKTEGSGSLKLGEDTSHRNISLVSPLNADLWLRIPCECNFCGESSSPTCIMMRICNCQLIAEDGYLSLGLEAVLSFIIQMSSVGQESKRFTSNVLQFLQLNRSSKESNAVFPDTSGITLSEAKCCIDELSIKFFRSKRENTSSELVAEANLQLQFSASFENEIPICLDVHCSSLVLYSFLTSVILVQHTSSGSASFSLDIHLSKPNELLIVVPLLKIWLHMSAWYEITELLGSYASKFATSSIFPISSNYSVPSPTVMGEGIMVDFLRDTPESPSASSSFQTRNIMQGSVDLIVKSVNIGLSLHFPIWIKEYECNGTTESNFGQKFPESSSVSYGERVNFEPKQCKYILVNFHSRDSELFISGRYAKLKSVIEKARGMLLDYEDKGVQSWPFFLLNQVSLEAEICQEQEELLHSSAEVRVEGLDVWLSHQIFYLWSGIQLEIPETGSSQFSFGSIDLKVLLRKASVLLTDGRGSSDGPLFEILMRNLFLHNKVTGDNMEMSFASELLVNYNNIHEVLWEPFIEPWNFQININRKNEKSALLNTYIVTDIHMESAAPLNLNLTEPLLEAVFRATEMIKESWGLIGVDLSESLKFLECETNKNVCARRYAPYVLKNETSLPLLFYVYRGIISEDDFDVLTIEEKNVAQPGSSVPIYIDETPEEQIFSSGPTRSSNRLNEKKSNKVVHHMVSIQLDGTSMPSNPISMDLIGISYFEVDFSKASDRVAAFKNGDASMYSRKSEENRMYQDGGYIFPVVFDVSLQRYGKLIRLYSTVIIFNATSMPLELRFDIPFGVSPKVLDPIYPGQKFPLPLHLAEAGCMRWRPLGNTFLWSDAHQLSNISSQENRPGFLRSFVCYPSHPSSDPFRCCMLFQDISLSSSSGEMKGLFPPVKETLRRSLDKEKRRFIHEVIFTSPLLVKNYLPRDLSFTIESGGVTRSMFLSEVDSASIYYIDVTHDMGIEFHMGGFKPSTLKFPRAETFISVAKLSGTKFSLTETMTFYPDSSNGPLYVIVEKVMDAFCGARELCISVPFLLYNCTGLSLSIEDCGNTVKGNKCNIPSCYHLAEQQKFLAKEDGLSLLCSNLDSHSTLRKVDNQSNVSSKCGTISLRENVNLPFKSIVSKHFISIGSSTNSFDHFENDALDDQEAALSGLGNRRNTSSQSSLIGKSSSIVDNDSRKVKACMYSPHPNISASELMVRVRRYKPEYISEDTHTSLWSSPFFLVPASGSTCVVVPQSLSNEAYIISVTSNPVTGPFSGRTRAVTFQPRYVISNACSKDLCYRQKGTDFVFHLGTGQHSELHWSDRTRELLISIRFNEPGCLWSGSFSPDHLGDTQVKIRNYFLSTSNMVRVEVQNADVSVREEKIIGSPHGNSGTHLILLSDDNTGFMPYRIDNFSKERLRVCQQKCENSETIVHPYTSCLYAWDEPCYPRRLLVEVPGECILGLFALDDARDHLPICIPSNSEKPERKFFLSVHGEGAVKVLSVIDLNNHLLIDNEDTNFPAFKDKKKPDQKQEEFVCYTEKILVHISFIGISLINCDPQELLFVCAKDTKIDVVQSVDQQKFSFQISSLQIDNQLRNTLYPVILSFDHDCMFNSSSQVKNKDKMHIASDNSPDPIFCLSAAKWRNKDVSLVSFEYISLRFAAVRLEIEEDVILSVLDFIRSVISRLQTTDFQWADSTKSSLVYENNKIRESLPSVVPIGAPWQQIYCLAGWKKKIYVELFDLGPIKLTVSFSSTPWLLRNGGLSSSETLVHFGSSAFQRGLMALADVEGAQIYLKQLTIAHHMASLESIEEILIRHYTWQLIHEIYKIFGSAGVIGNPMGFARNVGLGIKDFLSVPSKGLLQSPTRLITGVAQGTTSLFSTTVYAISDATTQFSKAAHKGIVAFTYDEQAVAKMGKQHKDVASQSKGVLNEVLEGLTGLLQSPIKGAEKHGLLGILSGMALGIAGLVARPVAGILEVTGKTAQSIRNRSSRHQPKRFRVRLPRPLSKEMPLRPYSWEEAIGSSMLLEAKGFKLKDEIFVTCKALKQSGKFVTITKRLILVFSCSSLEGLGTPGFCGISDPEWTVEVEMGLEDVIHVDREAAVVNIVGSSSQTLRQHHLKRGSTRTTRWNPPHLLPLFQTSMEFVGEEEAEDLLQVLLSIIERGREQGWGLRVMHQSSLR